MGERKVLNKYIPPDFDPAKLSRSKRWVGSGGAKASAAAHKLEEIRMMLPMNVQCLTCGNFMYKGTKFNSKKETVAGDEYLGLKTFRFVMKCSGCNAYFSIKTDLRESSYEVEYGVSRNFEPSREKRKAAAEEKEARAAEERHDAVKALENRTEDSRRQLELLDELEDLRAAKVAQASLGLNADALLAMRGAGAGAGAGAAGDYEGEDEEDEAVLQRAFAAARARAGGDGGGQPFVKRLREEEDEEEEDGRGAGRGAAAASSSSSSSSSWAAPAGSSSSSSSSAGAAPSRPAASAIGPTRPTSSAAARPVARLFAIRPKISAAEHAGDGAGPVAVKRARGEEAEGGDGGGSSATQTTAPPPPPPAALPTVPKGGLVGYDSDEDD
jgi:hypothetical protein